MPVCVEFIEGKSVSGTGVEETEQVLKLAERESV